MRRRTKKRKSSSNAAFTLIELMVVVAVISLLASLASTRMQIFSAKSKQSEAKMNLGIIYTLAEAYRGENGSYNNPIPAPANLLTATDRQTSTSCLNTNGLGFRITDCTKSRYHYIFAPTATTFLARARELTPGAFAGVTERRVFSDCDASVPADLQSLNNNKVFSNNNVAGACF